MIKTCFLVCWSSGNAFVSEAGGRSLNLVPVKFDTVLPTACHHCNNFFKKKLFCLDAMTRRWAPQTRHMLQRNTTSTMKDFIRLWIYGKNFANVLAFAVKSTMQKYSLASATENLVLSSFFRHQLAILKWLLKRLRIRLLF